MIPPKALGQALWMLGCSLLALACATPRARSEAEALARTRSTIRAVVRDQQLPSVAYLMLDRDGVLLDVTAGRVDAGRSTLASPRTLYMAYSITKVVTAIAVLQLVERGAIELDAPLGRYFRAHPYGPGVTIRRLLAHTAGVPNPAPLDWFFVEGQPLARQQALRRVLRDNAQLDGSPGGSYGYSNIGYWLLEKAIEAASGLDYGAYLQAHVFSPLDVADHEVSFSLPPPERMATGHIRRMSLSNLVLYLLAPSEYWVDARDGWSRFARVEGFGRGYGGAFATAHALGAVLQDLLRDRPVLLGVESRAMLFERQRVASGRTLDSSLGWVVDSLDGVEYVGKQGGGLGFQGNVRIYPTLGLASVYLANATALTAGPIDDLSDRLDGPIVRLRAGR
ncbi:MAG: serine hydrolase [Myxococcales bacterium]|nr:serine hydrolase [Myxococcales bacterium]